MTDIATRDQIRSAAFRAAEAFTFSRRIQFGPCDFGRSHRDGICDRCISRDQHDAEIARQWREARSA